MKLEKYISDLLYRHDLVIIPGFGGVVARRKPAHFNEETFVFSPPYKELSFNASLQNNDGLLADYVASVEGISYKQAMEKIEKSVTDWKKSLQNEKRIKLDQIGVFSLINEDKIIFLPLTTRNYLPEAYGLTSFIHRPSAKKRFSKEKTQADKKNLTTQPVVKPKKRLHHPYKNNQSTAYPLWKYAAIVLLGLGLFGAGVTLLQNDTSTPVETYQKATFVLQKDFPAIQLGDKSKKNVENTGTATVKTQEDTYFIISGAFRSKQNALKKIDELKSSGFDARLVGQNKRGLWMVAFEGFTDEEDARQKLADIRDFQKTAWLFIRK